MKKSEVHYAERKAMEVFDAWNECTGMFQICCGYYDEISSIIEDAVHIGIQMAIYGKIGKNSDGEIIRSDIEEASSYESEGIDLQFVKQKKM